MLREVVKKNGYFTVRLTVMGGSESAPSALTVSKCENFDPFFSLKFDSLKNWGFKKLNENES